MNFNEYLNTVLPGFSQIITQKEYEELNNLYNNYIQWLDTEQNCLKKHGEIDYTIDFEKASIKRVQAKNILDNKINQIQIKYNNISKSNNILK